MNEQFLREAIQLSIDKMQAGEGGPFGAVIVKDGEIGRLRKFLIQHSTCIKLRKHRKIAMLQTIKFPHVLLQAFMFCLLCAHTSAESTHTIVTGSCIKQAQPMPLLRQMAQAKPDLTLLLGDNIYADTADMDVMRAKYETLGANADFQALRNEAPMLAVWDDHDYGVNDGGADFPHRAAAQTVFLDFWQVPAESPRRQRAGVYHAKTFGEPGQRVQVILLDTRYHRSPLNQGERRVGGPYYPDDDPTKTMLGEEQWSWLEQQLKQPADLRLIGSGIQIIAEAAGQETWSNLPHERKRLFDLIQKTHANGVILLSGDRHWSELSVESDLGPYPIYDLTSSSINQKHPRGTPTQNRFRDLPTTWHEENFGKILIDWTDRQIEMQIVNAQGEVPIKKTLSLNDLQVKAH